MRNISIMQTTSKDIDLMQVRLRASDIQEIWAAGHRTPYEALTRAREISISCFTAFYHENPCAMFGFTFDTPEHSRGSIWLLGTDEILKARIEFLRTSKPWVNFFLAQCPELYNYVDARNKASIAWLKWLGADIKEAEPYGPDQMPFHYFQFSRS